MMSGGANATIVPKSPRLTSSTAFPPNLVARILSKLVGAPAALKVAEHDHARFFAGLLASASQTWAPMPPSRSA
jgi:hypothetical protein